MPSACTIDDQFADASDEVEERAAELERLAADYADKDESLARQLARLKDVGAAVAAERKSLAETGPSGKPNRAAALEADRRRARNWPPSARRPLREIAALREQAPELEGQAAPRSNACPPRARHAPRAPQRTARLRSRQPRRPRRHPRAGPRGSRPPSRAGGDARPRQGRAPARGHGVPPAVDRVAGTGGGDEADAVAPANRGSTPGRPPSIRRRRQVDATTQHLAEQAEQLQRERERCLGSPRARWNGTSPTCASGTGRSCANSPPATRNATASDSTNPGWPRSMIPQPIAPLQPAVEELDPGDRQLGELLRSHELVDGDTLTALWAEAGRQRRTLRQVLLASGAITLYQLALIEAGNLDALVLGRFRVIDRLRATPREAIYRVFDPSARPREPADGRRMCSCFGTSPKPRCTTRSTRTSSGSGSRRPATRPTRTSRRASRCWKSTAGRRCCRSGSPGCSAPTGRPHAAHPGCWVRLATMAAAGHRRRPPRTGWSTAGSRPTRFLLTAGGVLKVTGFGEPPWLAVGPSAERSSRRRRPTCGRSGRCCSGGRSWPATAKRAAKPKPFPEALLAVIRRLEADPEPPMADTVAAGEPYESARGTGRRPEPRRPGHAVQRRRLGEAPQARRGERP